MRMYLPKTKILMAFLMVGAIFMSCSSDDSGDSGNLDGVPSGEIVALELRNETLTGFSGLSRNEGSQKWWSHTTSDFNFSGCGEEGEDYSYDGLGYYAFYPDGSMYSKSGINGTPTYLQEWEWTDSSLSAIYVRGETSVPFTVTYLNEDNVVYGSNQSVGGGCSLTSYEQLGDPHYVD